MSEAEEKYGEDLTMRDSLMSLVPLVEQRVTLDAHIQKVVDEFKQKLEAALKPLQDDREEIQQTLDQAFIVMEAYIRDTARDTGRRSFMGGHVVVQKRKRPGDYDPEILEDWADGNLECLVMPKGVKNQAIILKYLRENAPELLVYDEDTAVKEATRLSPSGAPAHKNAPVKLAEYFTNISTETFERFLTQLQIEFAVDSRVDPNGVVNSESDTIAEIDINDTGD